MSVEIVEVPRRGVVVHVASIDQWRSSNLVIGFFSYDLHQPLLTSQKPNHLHAERHRPVSLGLRSNNEKVWLSPHSWLASRSRGGECTLRRLAARVPVPSHRKILRERGRRAASRCSHRAVVLPGASTEPVIISQVARWHIKYTSEEPAICLCVFPSNMLSTCL